jgi:cytosine/adenosine deaminase-related metal-dependent hydrolase
MLIKSRWIVPISSTPIENGWIRIEEGVITALGTNYEPRSTIHNTIIDLGHCAIFPGLINAHAHLEFDQGDHPRDSFAAWVRSLQTKQTERQGDEETKRWEEAIWFRNINRLIATGTTTVVNHCNMMPSSLTTPHLLHICEIVGSSPERGAESYREACRQRLQLLDGDISAVVSPTSLYAVSPVILEQFLEQRDRTALVSIHIKESEEEELLYKKGQGPLTSFVKQRGGQMWLSDPVNWLQKNELLGPQTLLVHGNYLNDSDLELLQGTGVSVIHCPGSHRYFGHQHFPLKALREKGINIAIGTDSLASNEDLSMLREMRLLQQSNPELSKKDIIRMATIDGAKALGDEANRGSLEPGKCADLIAVPCEGQDPYEALLMAEKVEMTMVTGRVLSQVSAI